MLPGGHTQALLIITLFKVKIRCSMFESACGLDTIFSSSKAFGEVRVISFAMWCDGHRMFMVRAAVQR